MMGKALHLLKRFPTLSNYASGVNMSFRGTDFHIQSLHKTLLLPSATNAYQSPISSTNANTGGDSEVNVK
jgi:hypothetical protein